MNVQLSEITIPNIRLNFDQLLTIIRHLGRPERIQIAKVLAETEMDTELDNLIAQLAVIPEKNVSEDDIAEEIQFVRKKHKRPELQ